MHETQQRWKVIQLAQLGWKPDMIEQATNISERVQRRIKSCYAEHNDVWPPQHYMPRPPPANKMDTASRDALLQAFGIEPRLKLLQASAIVKDITGADRRYSHSTMSRTLLAHDITGLKKVRYVSNRRDQDMIDAYLEEIGHLDRDMILFADETGKDIESCLPQTGRSVRGTQPVVVDRPEDMRRRHRDVNMFGVMNYEEGMLFAHAFRGSCDTETLVPILEEGVVPFLHPYPQRNSVLVLDNWSVHHTPEVRRVIESTGAKILYLPPYCPELNPIELAWAYVEKKAKDVFMLPSHTGEDLTEMMPRLAMEFTGDLAKNAFRRSGLP